MNVLRIMDRKPVTLISTEHSTDLMDTGKKNHKNEVVMKPAIINWYNKYMGAVDRNDQLAFYSAFNCRTVKWWKKSVFRLFNLAMVNAFILFKEWKVITGYKRKLEQKNIS